MLGQFGKKEFQILVSVETVCLGRFDDAVKHCAGLGAVVGFHDDKVLSPDGERADRLLGMIVVGRNVAVRQENAKVLFLIDAVGKRLANIAATRYMVVLGLCPREISVNLWLKLFLTLFLTVRRGQVKPYGMRRRMVEQLCPDIMCLIRSGLAW